MSEIRPGKLALEEYRSLREELLAIYNRQQRLYIEVLIVIGALSFFFFTQRTAEDNVAFFYIPAVIIPTGITAAIVQAGASYLRGCRIHLYLAHQKKQHDCFTPLEDGAEYYGYSHWSFISKKSIVERFDLVVMLFLLIIFCVLSVLWAYTSCGIELHSVHSIACIIVNSLNVVAIVICAVTIKKEYSKYKEKMMKLMKASIAPTKKENRP
jgi:hypothetical protein